MFYYMKSKFSTFFLGFYFIIFETYWYSNDFILFHINNAEDKLKIVVAIKSSKTKILKLFCYFLSILGLITSIQWH